MSRSSLFGSPLFLGFDHLEQMLDRVGKNAEKAGATNAEFKKGTIDELPLEDASADCIISNCVINLAPDKEAVFREMFRVLKPGGTLYLSVPDKRYTFDSGRPVTPIGHLFEDYERGPDWSRRGHFEEWVRLVDKVEDGAGAAERVEKLLGMDYSIHFHVWTQAEMFELLGALRRRLALDFDVEFFLKQGNECIFILTKNAPTP